MLCYVKESLQSIQHLVIEGCERWLVQPGKHNERGAWLKSEVDDLRDGGNSRCLAIGCESG